MRELFRYLWSVYRDTEHVSDLDFENYLYCECVSGYTWDWKSPEHEKIYRFFRSLMD